MSLSELTAVPAPTPSTIVHNVECTQCFDTSSTKPGGIDVCLHCFNASCTRAHSIIHRARNPAHAWALNILRTRRSPTDVDDSKSSRERRMSGAEPPAKMTKLTVGGDDVEKKEREEKEWEVVTKVKYQGVVRDDVPSSLLSKITQQILTSPTPAQKNELAAWEEQINPCEHTLTLTSTQTPPTTISPLPPHCSQCELSSNLWLCLTCGVLSCGRAQYGVTPPTGNGHALAHYRANPAHAVSVKLGTITAEGTADCYCYTCDDGVLDLELQSHLRTFGVEVGGREKTEKSMTELQLEHNLKYDFSLTTTAGESLEPVFGPGLTGLKNLGNSCYMASVLQTLFALPAFASRYGPTPSSADSMQVDSPSSDEHAKTCTHALPADCLECQMRKVADGLLSGRYSVPDDSVPVVGGGAGLVDVVVVTSSSSSSSSAASSSTPAEAVQEQKEKNTTDKFQAGLPPSTLKALLGKGHAEFATMRQQDSEEFLGWVVSSLRRDLHRSKDTRDPTQVFAYALQQRLQCTVCRKVRYRTDAMDVVGVSVPAIPEANPSTTSSDGSKVGYRPVRLTDCLDAVVLGADGEELNGYSCPECKRGTTAVKNTKFASFPEVLVVHAKKFQLVNWVPAKLDIPLILPADDALTFDERYLGRGLQAGEEELPTGDDATASTPALPEFNADAMAVLEGMGFPKIRAQKALLATGNTVDSEVAMEWLFAHMDDADIDEPIVLAAPPTGPEPSADQIAMLADMGFTNAQAKKALRETSGNAERAVEWLFNHPDDNGEEPAATAATPDTSTSAPSAAVPGSTEVPVRYRLKAFISHKGPSVHSGHYVAHVKVDEQWVLFNDEKVVKADKESVDELKKLAYLYFFERV